MGVDDNVATVLVALIVSALIAIGVVAIALATTNQERYRIEACAKAEDVAACVNGIK